MKLIVYLLIGLGIHVGVWHLPLDVNDWRMWGDILLWPFVLIWHWPSLLPYLPVSMQQGLGHLIGTILLFCLIGGFFQELLRRSRGER